MRRECPSPIYILVKRDIIYIADTNGREIREERVVEENILIDLYLLPILLFIT